MSAHRIEYFVFVLAVKLLLYLTRIVRYKSSISPITYLLSKFGKFVSSSNAFSRIPREQNVESSPRCFTGAIFLKWFLILINATFRAWRYNQFNFKCDSENNSMVSYVFHAIFLNKSVLWNVFRASGTHVPMMILKRISNIFVIPQRNPGGWTGDLFLTLPNVSKTLHQTI